VIGIDLAEDKQALAVIDHDVRVLARRTVRVKAFRLGQALDWAAAQAKAKGFERVTVACEPTGPRWMQVQRLCAERGLPMVCVQPLVSHIARAADCPGVRLGNASYGRHSSPQLRTGRVRRCQWRPSRAGCRSGWPAARRRRATQTRTGRPSHQPAD
jgi:hypothetical protein